MRNILVIGAEILSRNIDRTDRNTAVLFGDGAGAMVLQASELPTGLLSFVLGADGSGAKHLIVPGISTNAVITEETIRTTRRVLEDHLPTRIPLGGWAAREIVGLPIPQPLSRLVGIWGGKNILTGSV